MIEKPEPAPSNLVIFGRGIKGLCPHCGKGHIFKSYLKPNQNCSFCKEDFSKIRADDGPAWLTILLVGHILAPFMIHFAKHEFLSMTSMILLFIAVALFLIFIILPRAKGLFIAIIWLMNRRKTSQDLGQ